MSEIVERIVVGLGRGLKRCGNDVEEWRDSLQVSMDQSCDVNHIRFTQTVSLLFARAIK